MVNRTFVGADDRLVHIGEHVEVELSLIGDRQAVIGALRADGQHGRSPGGDRRWAGNG